MRLLLAMVMFALHVPGARQQVPADLFDSLHAQSQGVMAATLSVGADFTETTVSSLLAEPIVAHGTLIAAEPGRLIMKYSSGERRTVIIADDRLVVLWPDPRRHEARTIRRTRERVDRYFRDASPQELRRLFDLATSTDPNHPETYKIEMTPRRDEIREGLVSLQLWVNQDTVMMERLLVVFPGGDSKLIELDNLRLNVPVDRTTFALPRELQGRD